jgi:hypothetical protein
MRDSSSIIRQPPSSVHDIYDPPPAPVAWNPPKPEPLVYTAGDVVCLVVLFVLLLAGSIVVWRGDLVLTIATTFGGSLVILESWFTALGFLHRRRSLGLKARWTVFLAALIPWLAGLGIAATLMLALFLVSDWTG